MQGRLLGILDSENRYYSLPEAGVGNVDIDAKFWLLATANPTTGGYDTSSIDRALSRRFGAIFSVDQPLCDEPRKFEYELMRYFTEEFSKQRAERITNWLSDVRQNKDTKVNTGEVVQLIRNSSFAPIQEAASWTIAPKYRDGKAIVASLSAHFDNEERSDKHKLNGKGTRKVPAKKAETTDEDARVAQAPVLEKRIADVDTAVKANSDLMKQLQELLQSNKPKE